MAVVQNTLIGKSRQSVGGTTFSTWKGINVLKSKPTAVANPKTDLQLMQRSALQQTVSLYRVISAVVKRGWRKFAIQKSEYNAFASNTLKNAFNFSVPPVATLGAEDLMITNGSISTGNESFEATVISAASMRVEWSDSLSGNQAATDEVQVVIMSSDATRVKAIIIDKKTRAMSTVTLVPLAGEEFEAGDVVLVGFVRPDYSDASPGSSVIATA